MRDKVRGRLSECSSLPRECSDPKFLRRRCRSSISVVDSRATFGAKAKRNLCATTTAKLFRARTRWVARFFWFTITPLEGAEEGTDRWAIEHNWVSITPLRLDLTDEKALARALSLAQTPPVSAAKKR